MLQQGLDGYAGVRDTFVSTAGWEDPPQYEVNYGLNRLLTVSRDGRDNVLVRFDLAGIPPSAVVSSARLYLYNTTGDPESIVRRVKAFRVLRSWDEGNQVGSAIDAPGKRGATGKHAFAFFPGEGTNVPWGYDGLGAGTDYEAAAVGTVEVRGPGEYTWDISAVVQDWVRHPGTNHGLVLRDDSGSFERHGREGVPLERRFGRAAPPSPRDRRRREYPPRRCRPRRGRPGMEGRPRDAGRVGQSRSHGRQRQRAPIRVAGDHGGVRLRNGGNARLHR